jgi:eukaryotic-like serine/threonine-protein kinase
LHHPNIVEIYEVFDHDGHTYLSLELAPGGPLAAKLTGRPENPREAAALLEGVARAVHYAHTHGIVHRDLKPSNILLAVSTEAPFAVARGLNQFAPKITDFGIAKRLFGDSSETRDGEVIGTPAYMAPEQASGQLQQVGPTTDIYALGVVLYEMLTGRVPLQGPTTLDTLVLVRTEEPIPPRRLQPKVPRDLETICLKCLEKNLDRRYASAAGLADDLKRFLDGEPVHARPTPTWERAWKWARRRPAVATLAAGILAVAALGFGLVASQWQRAERQAVAERQARRQVERLSAGITLDKGAALCEAGDVAHGLLWLARSLELAERSQDADLERVARCDLAGWLPFLVRPRAQCAHRGWVWTVAFSPDGRQVVTGGSDGVVQRWDAATGHRVGEPLKHPHSVWSVAFSPDGKSILTGCGDFGNTAGEARLWDAASGEPLQSPLSHPGRVTHAAFSPDGRTFLTVCEQQVQIWSAASGRPLGAALKHPKPAVSQPRVQPKMIAAFSPDGSRVATGGEDGSARLWDAATGLPRGKPLATPGPVLTLAFSPDGQSLLTGSFSGGAQLWDLATGERRGPALAHRGRVKAVAFSPDGQLLATGGVVEEIDPTTDARRITGGEARLWHAATGHPVGAPLAHPGPVWSLAFSPLGRTLLTGGEDGAARLFLVATGAQMGRPLRHEGTVTAVAFNHDGTAALMSSAGGSDRAAARIWELQPEGALPRAVVQSGGRIHVVALSPDGRELLTGAEDRQARLWDLTAGRLARSPLPHEGRVTVVAFSPDQRTFLTGCENGLDSGVVRVWNLAGCCLRYDPIPTGRVSSGAYSPGGQKIVIGDTESHLRFWETGTGRALGPGLTGLGWVSSVAFTADGRGLLTGTANASSFWDLDSGRPLWERHGAPASSWAALHPNGTQAILIAGGFAHAYDLHTGQVQPAPLFHSHGGIRRMAFSADGGTIVSSGDDGTGRLWDVATGKAIGPPPCREGADAVAFGSDRLLAVAGADGRIALWNAPVPVEGAAERIRLWANALTGLELDERDVVRELSAEARQQRERQLQALGGPPLLQGR